jgi:cytochrome P450
MVDSVSSSPDKKFSTKFRLADLRPSAFEKLTQVLLDDPQWLLGLLRRYWPVPKFGKWAMLTRYDDVREALNQQDVFEVPFRKKMEELNGDRQNFLLGMQDGPAYQRQNDAAMKAFRLKDIAPRIAALSAEISREQVKRANGELDAIRDLVTFVPTELCVRYFGLPIPEQDRAEFPMWAIAMSAYTFDPLNNKGYHRAAIAGAERTRALVDHAIATTRKLEVKPNTILGRLLTILGDDDAGRLEIRAVLMGMITGFVPTNTMAAGHMLEMLLRRKLFLAQARAAALAGDDELLSHCLFEAMRFKPLNFGPFRRCSRDYKIAKQSTGATTIRKGTKVLVSTQSAMFDSRRIENPYEFDPHRSSSDYMLFGSGLHWCIGAFVADAQITQMFKALLVKNNLQRAPGEAGRLARIGPFPSNLVVQYDP